MSRLVFLLVKKQIDQPYFLLKNGQKLLSQVYANINVGFSACAVEKSTLFFCKEALKCSYHTTTENKVGYTAMHK